MKLVIAVIHNDFINEVTRQLTDNDYRFTKLASTGGFLKAGNTTLLLGVQENKLDDLVGLIKKECASLDIVEKPEDIKVSGANIFIMNMEDFKRM